MLFVGYLYEGRVMTCMIGIIFFFFFTYNVDPWNSDLYKRFEEKEFKLIEIKSQCENIFTRKNFYYSLFILVLHFFLVSILFLLLSLRFLIFVCFLHSYRNKNDVEKVFLIFSEKTYTYETNYDPPYIDH